jgi:excisionase family DNA binding protein
VIAPALDHSQIHAALRTLRRGLTEAQKELRAVEDRASGKRAGVCYFIGADWSLCKIGRSRDASVRLRQIQVGHPHRLQLLHVIQTDDAVELEALLHDTYEDGREQGEWFRLDRVEPALVRVWQKTASYTFAEDDLPIERYAENVHAYKEEIARLESLRAGLEDRRPPQPLITRRTGHGVTVAPMRLERLYTVVEAAQRVNANEQTVRRFLREGKIRGYYIGRVWRIPESSLQEWLDTMENRRPRREGED